MEIMDRESLRESLIKEKFVLTEKLRAKQSDSKDNSLSESASELSVVDNHPADTGSDAFERSKDLSLKEKDIILLQNIERALKKLELGEYGMCERCGNPIKEERLEVIPHTQYCYFCQEALEREKDRGGSTRPVEEEIFNFSLLDKEETKEDEG